MGIKRKQIKQIKATWLAFLFLGLFAFQTVHATDDRARVYPLYKSTFAEAPVVCDTSNKGWGYSYDSLLLELSRWKASPFVTVDSIGVSVQGRTLWMVTVQSVSGSSSKKSKASLAVKPRVMVHARTHPREWQSNRVIHEMLQFLLDSTQEAVQLRSEFVFSFVPMLNPDGVELGCKRWNANGVDMESNWDKTPLEPEVQSLKNLFQKQMNGPSPIRVALNMHSSVNLCTRFFFYHLAGGTSPLYAGLEKDFIKGVQAHFPNGVEDWSFPAGQSWATRNPGVYPESFFWSEYQEEVMALTYEDSNCPNAGGFDSTGRALVLGASQYIRTHPTPVSVAFKGAVASLSFSWEFIEGGLKFKGALESERQALLLNQFTHWKLYDLQGRLVDKGVLMQSTLQWNRQPSPSLHILEISSSIYSHLSRERFIIQIP